MFHQVNTLSIYSNHLWSKNITISTACLSTHWTAHIKCITSNKLLSCSILLKNEAFRSSCPCGMFCMSQVIQNQVSPNDPSAWSFFMHIYQQTWFACLNLFKNEWVQRSINMELLHAFYTNMTQVAVPQVCGTIITILYLLAWTCVSVRSRFNKPFILGARPLKVLFK